MVERLSISTLRNELLRCEAELERAKDDGRASHVRLQAALIRLNRARVALEQAMQEAGE
jgi:hypothetical protein